MVDRGAGERKRRKNEFFLPETWWGNWKKKLFSRTVNFPSWFFKRKCNVCVKKSLDFPATRYPHLLYSLQFILPSWFSMMLEIFNLKWSFIFYYYLYTERKFFAKVLFCSGSSVQVEWELSEPVMLNKYFVKCNFPWNSSLLPSRPVSFFEKEKNFYHEYY